MKVMNQKNKYISLKEAAKISGYSPDYVGQLIRQGKLPGKQVFSNVAWVTTEKALERYIKGEKNKSKSMALNSFREQRDYSRFLKIMLYIGIGFLVIFILFLFYIFAISIDKNIDKKALERVETHNP